MPPYSPRICSVRASGCPPKNLSSTAENTGSSGAAAAKSVMLERSFRSSGKPNTAVGSLSSSASRALLISSRCAQRRLAQVSARLVKPGDGIKLRCAAHAQPRDLREDVPDPVAALAAAADLAQSGGIVPALRGEKAVEIIHSETSSEAETDKWLRCKSLLIMPFRIGIVKRAAAQIFFYNALALRYNGAVEKGAFPWS